MPQRRPGSEKLMGGHKKLTPRRPRTPGKYRINLGEGLGRSIEVSDAQLRALVKSKQITPTVYKVVTGKSY